MKILSKDLLKSHQRSLCGEPCAPPPPPKAPVIARTIVEIVTERAVSIENIVIPCSRKKIQIISANDVF